MSDHWESLILMEKNIKHVLECRNLKKMDKEAYVRDLGDAPWDAAFVFDDVDEIIDAWYDIFNDILDKHAPVKTMRIKRNSQPKWFTEELDKGIPKGVSL